MDKPRVSKRKLQDDNQDDKNEQPPVKRARTEPPSSTDVTKMDLDEEPNTLSTPKFCLFNTPAALENPHLKNLKTAIQKSFAHLCATHPEYSLDALEYYPVANFITTLINTEEQTRRNKTQGPSPIHLLPLLAQLILSEKSHFFVGGQRPDGTKNHLGIRILNFLCDRWTSWKLYQTYEAHDDEVSQINGNKFHMLLYVLLHLAFLPTDTTPEDPTPRGISLLKDEVVGFINLDGSGNETLYQDLFAPMCFSLFESNDWTDINAAILGIASMCPKSLTQRFRQPIRIDSLSVIYKTLDAIERIVALHPPHPPLFFLRQMPQRVAKIIKRTLVELTSPLLDRLFSVLVPHADAYPQAAEPICLLFSWFINSRRNTLEISQFELVLDWFYKLAEKVPDSAGPIISVAVAACGPYALSPTSPLLKKEVWKKSAHVWWGGFGVFSEIPREILQIIKQKTILTDEDNLIYFDKIIPYFMSEEKIIWNGSDVPGLIGFFEDMGYTCEKKHAPLLLKQMFPPDDSNPAWEYCHKDGLHPAFIFRLLYGVVKSLNEVNPAREHPLVAQYKSGIMNLVLNWFSNIDSDDDEDPSILGRQLDFTFHLFHALVDGHSMNVGALNGIFPILTLYSIAANEELFLVLWQTILKIFVRLFPASPYDSLPSPIPADLMAEIFENAIDYREGLRDDTEAFDQGLFAYILAFTYFCPSFVKEFMPCGRDSPLGDENTSAILFLMLQAGPGHPIFKLIVEAYKCPRMSFWWNAMTEGDLPAVLPDSIP